MYIGKTPAESDGVTSTALAAFELATLVAAEAMMVTCQWVTASVIKAVFDWITVPSAEANFWL